ncbi:MAG: GGDEF domain-containing protein [Huintestinicola sp.]
MRQRKNIAVITGHVVNSYTSELFDGIISQANSLGYNVAVFSLFSLWDELTPHQIGEENIYNLINFDKIDGVIYHDSSIWPHKMKARITDILHKRFNGPVVCINSNNPDEFVNITIDERSSFSVIVDHFIEVHKFKKIYCLTGMKDNYNAEERLAGYRQSMERHGLEVKDSYIFYGDFWKTSGEQLARDIHDGKVEMPEAVVCANDSMASALCNTFVELGHQIPKEMSIAAFDTYYGAYSNVPSITGCVISNRTLGAKCMCRLYNLMTGENVKPVFNEPDLLVTFDSCGCETDLIFQKKYGKQIRATHNTDEYFHTSTMLERITSVKDLDSCIYEIFSHLHIINNNGENIEQFALCLDENWNNFSENDDEYAREGYSDTAILKAFYTDYKTHTLNIKVNTKDMFPPQMVEDKPFCCYFTPLHFADRCFGYIVTKYKSNGINADRIFRLWVKYINTSLEYLRVKERLEVINSRIYISSLRDGLTGLYNRMGYKTYAMELFERSRTEHKPFLLIVADLDKLKYINDCFGHSEGDNAITVVAQALLSCSGNSEKCFRIGGDEFAVVGCYDYDDMIPQYYNKRINGYLDRYNENSQKKYAVSTSIGCFFGYVDGISNIEECYDAADKLMYENKLARRQQRTD